MPGAHRGILQGNEETSVRGRSGDLPSNEKKGSPEYLLERTPEGIHLVEWRTLKGRTESINIRNLMNAATALQEEVERELRWDPEVHAEQIGVSVDTGVVLLTGTVDNLYEKWAAEKATIRVAGVRALANEIQVDLAGPDHRADADVAAAIMNQFDWNHLVPDTVKVKVSNSWVTLEGFVEAYHQRREAERIIRSVMGIKGFVNHIEIRPKVNVTLVKSSIIDAIRRNAVLDAENITVENNGGKVTLKGYVSSWVEKAEARRIAWAAPGVTMVEDHLTLDLT